MSKVILVLGIVSVAVGLFGLGWSVNDLVRNYKNLGG